MRTEDHGKGSQGILKLGGDILFMIIIGGTLACAVEQIRWIVYFGWIFP